MEFTVKPEIDRAKLEANVARLNRKARLLRPNHNTGYTVNRSSTSVPCRDEVSAIETEFNILLEPEEFASIISYEAAVQLLETNSPAS